MSARRALASWSAGDYSTDSGRAGRAARRRLSTVWASSGANNAQPDRHAVVMRCRLRAASSFPHTGFPQRLWKQLGKACGQATATAFASVTCYALRRKCAAAFHAASPARCQFSTVVVRRFCTSLWTTPTRPLPTITWHGMPMFCPVRDGASRSSPQRLWTAVGKACGQPVYVSERKGTADGVRSC